MLDQATHQMTYNDHVESLRSAEYPLLCGTTYLDHAGTTLYASSLIDAYHHDLKNNMYGNPHSDSPASDLSTQRVDEARLAVLNYFHADPDHFDVVFTANATAAVKLVADCFRDQQFWYGFHKDAHSSIVGVREVARAGSRCFVSNDDVEDWIAARSTISRPEAIELFAYPAQSNMTGYRLPYSWAARIRGSTPEAGGKQKTYVLLDAASYLTTGRLDLGNHEAAPDFIALSFYKIFGFPDLGALIVRKAAEDILTYRRYFGGGTVDQVTVIDSSFHAKKTQTIHDFLEDGTLPFHNIVALKHAIAVHEKLFGSALAIANHTSFLSGWLYQQLASFKHFNNTPLVRLHKDPLATYGNPSTQGPILAFSLCDSEGSFIGKSHFERLAIDCGFQLRTGGVCNPGGIASMLDLNHWELRRNFTEGARCGGDIDVVGGKPTGIIRVSLGPMSTFDDVRRFAEFVEWFFVDHKPQDYSASALSPDAASKLDLQDVSPITHCSPVTLQRGANLAAFHVWDGQWCIVRPHAATWQPLTSTELLKPLSCSLEPEQGVLRISRTGMPDLSIKLWDRPKQEVTTTSASDTKAFDIYTDLHIIDWLSQALGTHCTLARYRGQDAKTLPAARICLVSACHLEFATRSDLHQHYKRHAEPFLKTHMFHKCYDIGTQAQSPHLSSLKSPTSITISTDPAPPTRPYPVGNRRSWTKKHLAVVFSRAESAMTDISLASTRVNEAINEKETEKQEQKRKSKVKKPFFARLLGRCIS